MALSDICCFFALLNLLGCSPLTPRLPLSNRSRVFGAVLPSMFLIIIPPCPTAVHPKTGRVCVPIDPANVREFDPFAVPTLGQLARQIDQYDKEHGEEVGNWRLGCTVSIYRFIIPFRFTVS